MQIIRYTPEKQEEWNTFIRSSKNGTFLFLREYMDYHSSRFNDHSLMFYQNNALLAVMPANISDTTFYTHQGLTYGGLVLSHKIRAQQVLALFDLLIPYVTQECHAERIVYRAVPSIYHSYPSDEDLYALFRNKAQLTERRLSTAILREYALPFRTLRRRQVKRAEQLGLYVTENQDIAAFWYILTNLLKTRHRTAPVHSEEEIRMLMKRFPENIRLFGVYSREHELLAGTVVYETTTVAHLQYIAANEAGKKSGALDLLFQHLIGNRYTEKRYIDFGVSVEKDGWYLNEGLQFQKEGFGGRAILYDTYEISLNNQ